uniref:Uncharacterized protein n=1 Tax=Anopheles merus TaxID=30066 RepID=A0A182UYT4_ANOME
MLQERKTYLLLCLNAPYRKRHLIKTALNTETNAALEALASHSAELRPRPAVRTCLYTRSQAAVAPGTSCVCTSSEACLRTNSNGHHLSEVNSFLTEERNLGSYQIAEHVALLLALASNGGRLEPMLCGLQSRTRYPDNSGLRCCTMHRRAYIVI